MIDLLAERLRMDGAELRMKNLLSSDSLPLTMAFKEEEAAPIVYGDSDSARFFREFLERTR